MTTAGDHVLDYDAAGQLVSSDTNEHGTDDYTWDFLGRMASAARSGSELARFTYGPSTDRVRKVEQGQTTYYLTPEFELRDGLATLYVMVGAQRVAKVEVATLASDQLPDLAPAELVSGVAEPVPDGLITAGDAWIAEAAELELFELEEGTADVDALLAASARRALAEVGAEEPKVTYFHYDHLGSVVAVTDAEGSVIERRTQYPYGMERSPAVPLAADYVFTGKEKDWSTGLLYFGARYYAPGLGRWVSADPLFIGDPKKTLENPLGTSLYAYGNGNPIAFVDPDGFEPIGPIDAFKILFVDAGASLSQSQLAEYRRDPTAGNLTLAATFVGVSAAACAGGLAAYGVVASAHGPQLSVAVGTAAKGLQNQWSRVQGAAQRLFAAARGATGTVWDAMEVTQAAKPGTVIPHSFELATSSGKFWVHPNATKHMVEYVTRNGASHGMPMNSQAMLTSLQGSVEAAASQGIRFGQAMQVGRWELIFSAGRSGDALPVLKHALYR